LLVVDLLRNRLSISNQQSSIPASAPKGS
jgi:hypothetical protein